MPSSSVKDQNYIFIHSLMAVLCGSEYGVITLVFGARIESQTYNVNEKFACKFVVRIRIDSRESACLVGVYTIVTMTKFYRYSALRSFSCTICKYRL